MDGVIVEYVNNSNVSLLTRYNYFWILWCDEVESNIFINGNCIELKENCFYLLPPHNAAYFDADLTPFKMSCIGFSFDFMAKDGQDHFIEIFRLFFKTHKYNAISANEVAMLQMRHIFECLELEKRFPKPSPQITQTFIRATLLILNRLENLPVHYPDINAQRVGKFFLLVKQYAHQHKKVEFYAQSLNISTKRLNQILRLYTNWNVTEAIQQVLVYEAISLLLNGMYSINQISDYLGFSDRSYFSKTFKRNTGLSPENYLIEVKEKEVEK